MIPDTEATGLVRKMFFAHGMNPADGIVAELAAEVTKAACPACARAAIAENHDSSTRAFTVKTFRGAVYERIGTAEHGLHLGQDEKAVNAGELEGFWRGKAAQVVREEYPELTRDEALYVALSAWWSECLPDVAIIRECVGPLSLGWLQGVLVYFRGKDNKAAQIAKLAAACRKRETSGIASLTESELP